MPKLFASVLTRTDISALRFKTIIIFLKTLFPSKMLHFLQSHWAPCLQVLCPLLLGFILEGTVSSIWHSPRHVVQHIELAIVCSMFRARAPFWSNPDLYACWMRKDCCIRLVIGQFAELKITTVSRGCCHLNRSLDGLLQSPRGLAMVR